METIEIIGGAAGVIVAGGAWLKWATVPVRGAYALGRSMGQLQGRPGKLAAAFGIGYRLGRRHPGDTP